jgi:hypothetical protein
MKAPVSFVEVTHFAIASARQGKKGGRESKFLMHALKLKAIALKCSSMAACVDPQPTATRFFCGCDFHMLTSEDN